MDAPRLEHSRTMIHRAFFCLVLCTGFVACLGKTTSLGGPAANQASATSTSTDDDGGTESGALWSSGDAATSGVMCQWYVWAPARTAVDCEYLLPTPADSPPDAPIFDAKAWDPHNVRVEVAPTKEIGEWVGTSDGCGSGDGWYYVAPAAGQTPTRFMICPKTCTTVASDGGGYMGLAAYWCPSR
jgi:hypothetical protein